MILAFATDITNNNNVTKWLLHTINYCKCSYTKIILITILWRRLYYNVRNRETETNFWAPCQGLQESWESMVYSNVIKMEKICKDKLQGCMYTLGMLTVLRQVEEKTFHSEYFLEDWSIYNFSKAH